MKRLLTCFLLLCFASVVFAYDVYIESIKTTPANCGNDGTIEVILGGKDVSDLKDVVYEAGGVSSSSPVIPGLNPGTYTVTVDGYIGNNSVFLSETAVVTGTASYVPLNARIIGSRPTVHNLPSGKIMLGINRGRLPYTVEVKSDGDLFDTLTFNSTQSSYDVENLPEGTYDLVVSDGCTSFYLSSVHISVLPQPPDFDCGRLSMYPGERKVADVEFSMLPYASNEYDEEHLAGKKVWWEYALSFDGSSYSEWTDMPQNGVLRDTLEGMDYCDVWNKYYSLKIRMKGGDGKELCRESFYIYKPDVYTQNYISIYETSGCVKDTLISFSMSGSYYHPPLSMKVTNVTRDTVLFDSLYVSNKLFPVTLDMQHDSILCEFRDAKGCVFSTKREVGIISTYDYWRGSSTSSPCYQNNVGVCFDGYSYVEDNSQYLAHIPPEGTVVELVEAPDTTLCFKAMWDRENSTWSLENAVARSEITASGNWVGLRDTATMVTDASLPSGRYVFHVTDGCGYDAMFTHDLDFYRYKTIEPLYIGDSLATCSGMEYFPRNRVVRYKCTTAGYGAEEEVQTRFSVYSPDGGDADVYDSSVNGGSFVINPQYNLDIQHFTVQDYYDVSYCSISKPVEIEYRNPASIDIKNIVSYRCAGSSGLIVVEPDSTTGIQPYKFELYSISGLLLSTSTTGVFRIDSNESSFRVKLTDGCNQSDAAYTEATRYVTLLNIGVDRLIRGKNVICFGESDSLYCRINAGVCEWTRPDGRVEQGRAIGVSCEDEKDLETGWYHMKITGLECEAMDSIFVDVEYPYNDTIYLPDVCDSDLPFVYDGMVFEESGFQTKYEWSVNGCDSTTTYHLTVNPTYWFDKEEIICETDLPYSYADTLFEVGTQSGLYSFYRKTIHGCDSVVNLQLIVGNVKDTVFREEIFKYEDFTKYGFNLPEQTSTGDFEHVLPLKTIYGCDSTVTLYLTVLPVVKANVSSNRAEVCGDETDFAIEYVIAEGVAERCSIRFSDNAIRAGFADSDIAMPAERDVFQIKLPDQVPADSYVVTLLFENAQGYVDEHVIPFTVLGHPAVVELKDQIFKYEDYPKYDFNLPPQTVIGDFEFVRNLHTVAGCDSTVTLQLSVLPVVLAEVASNKENMCGDETDFSVEYVITEGVAERCSIRFSDNAIRAGFVDNDIAMPAERDVFSIQLPELVPPDTYTVALLFENAQGYIDEHVIPFTVVGHPADIEIHDYVFKYEDYPKYDFNLPSQIETGEFVHVRDLQTMAGCDSTVTLYLSVYPVVKAEVHTHHPVLCGDEDGFAIEYEILEGVPDFCSVRFSDKALQSGFSDFTDGFPNGASVRVDLPDLVRPNDYNLTFSVENSYGYVDSHVVDFSVLYPSSIILQMWDDVLAVLNAENNGNYEFSSYQWYKDGKPMSGETQSFIYTPLDMNAEYHVELTRSSDGVAMASCPFVPEVQQSVSVYPTIIAPSQSLTLSAIYKGTVSMWTLSGIKLLERSFEPGKNSVPSPDRPGSYLLHVNFENGVKIKQMIIVR